ncbi:MAG: NAD(+)/NADH kinase [Anaerolineales bacterium]|nr:NAD(+)/NADH kinase [Anaerolineales bacterium]
MTRSPSRFLVISNPQVARSSELALEIQHYIQQYSDLHAECVQVSDVIKGSNDGSEMLLAVGGDGTMLRVGRVGARFGCPVLGFNLGEVGFLPQVPELEWRAALKRILAGDFDLERRMLVFGELIRDGENITGHHALNEIVVTRGALARPVHLETEVDSTGLATYVADGLIVSTPTGSTAYALAAGGPILPPTLRNLVVMPVSPHLSVGRAVVLAEGCTITITVRTDHQAILSADGQTEVEVLDGDCVRVRASERNCHFVRLQRPTYFYRDLAERLAVKGRSLQ